MSPTATSRLLAIAAAALLGSFAVRAIVGFGGPALETGYTTWFQPAGFLGRRLATRLRASARREERAP